MDSITKLLLSLDFDVLTIQELVNNDSAKERLKELAEKLNISRTSETYCFGISNFSSHSDSQENYGYIWRIDRVFFLRKNLSNKLIPIKRCLPRGESIPVDNTISSQIDREPAVGLFSHHRSGESHNFALLSIHLVPPKKKPWKEVKPLFSSKTTTFPIIIAGDFNLEQGHDSFNLYARPKGFRNSIDAKTSLKRSVRKLNHSYDNIWYRNFSIVRAKVINLYKFYKDIDRSTIYNGISDHSPVIATFQFN